MYIRCADKRTAIDKVQSVGHDGLYERYHKQLNEEMLAFDYVLSRIACMYKK